MDRLLQREPDRTVSLEAGGAIVCKQFTGPQASAEAAREHDYLQRFHRALGSDSRARCPRPIEIVTGDRAVVRMERARGEPLVAQLGSRSWTDGEVNRVASVLAGAVQIYIQTFGEPYFDFHLRNMTYEPAEGRVWLFDFGIPRTFPSELITRLRQRSPLDVTVANLLGSTFFEATRPRTVFQRRRHRQSFLLADAVRAELPVAMTEVRWIALSVWEAAAAHGGWAARAWYRSIGGMVGIGMRRRIFGIEGNGSSRTGTADDASD